MIKSILCTIGACGAIVSLPIPILGHLVLLITFISPDHNTLDYKMSGLEMFGAQVTLTILQILLYT